MLRAMEMGVVLWDFFLMGAAAAAASVYDTFFCLSAKTTYRIFSCIAKHIPAYLSPHVQINMMRLIYGSICSRNE